MTVLDDTLVEASSRAWSADQRASLRGAFTRLRDVFKDVVFIRGKRVTIKTATSGGILAPTTADCPFKPKSVQILSVSDETTNYTNFVMSWTWASTTTGGTVTFADAFSLFGAMPDGSYFIDLLLERE